MQLHPENVTTVTDNQRNVTDVIVTGVTPLPANYGLSNCACLHCRAVKTNKSNAILNHGPVKTYEQLAANEYNRVSLPGDVDYANV
jgi:hypothetical protein